jgi:catechol 2,3-dioxygenase-like lactoylglutathione lyase family enzyme
MPIIALDHVQVAAPRTPEAEEQARAFYGGLLGLQEMEKPDILKPKGGVWFSLGSGQLHVGIDEPFTPARKAHPAFLVSGLAELHSRLEAAGVPIAEAEPLEGVDRFHVFDPFGNRIELMERIAGAA